MSDVLKQEDVDNLFPSAQPSALYVRNKISFQNLHLPNFEEVSDCFIETQIKDDKYDVGKKRKRIAKKKNRVVKACYWVLTEKKLGPQPSSELRQRNQEEWIRLIYLSNTDNLLAFAHLQRQLYQRGNDDRKVITFLADVTYNYQRKRTKEAWEVLDCLEALLSEDITLIDFTEYDLRLLIYSLRSVVAKSEQKKRSQHAVDGASLGDPLGSDRSSHSLHFFLQYSQYIT